MSIRNNNNRRIKEKNGVNEIVHIKGFKNFVELASWDKLQLINLIYSILIDSKEITISNYGKTIEYIPNNNVKGKELAEDNRNKLRHRLMNMYLDK